MDSKPQADDTSQRRPEGWRRIWAWKWVWLGPIILAILVYLGIVVFVDKLGLAASIYRIF